jgi:hypothetical protein
VAPERERAFIEWHCGSPDHGAAARCVAAIRGVAGTGAHRWKTTRPERAPSRLSRLASRLGLRRA